jgi:predicted Fe-Mo cluster-binding NifX family protein
MLYLVAADDNKTDATISKRFGHAAYHLVVQHNPLEIVQSLPHDHDLPRHGLDRFDTHELVGIVAGNMGPGAFADAQALDIPVYIVRGATVEQAVARVSAGQIRRSDEPTMKQSVHGGHHEHHH